MPTSFSPMRVTMTAQRMLQDAGRETVLCLGRSYDVSDLVGSALIATGAAVRWSEPAEAREMAVRVVPERKTRKREAVSV